MKLDALMLFVALFVALVALCVSCDIDPSRYYETLDASGFTDIRLTGFEWFRCGDNDSYVSGFTAKNPKGKPVSGVVCCGYSKACTVRF